MNNSIKSAELLFNLTKDVNRLIEICKHYFLFSSTDVINKKHPNEDWSIADCVEHLNEFCVYYIPQLELVVEKGIQQNILPEENFSSNQMGTEAIMSVHPQNLPTMKTMGHFHGRDMGGENNNLVIQNYMDFQNRLLIVLEKAQKTSLTQILVPVKNRKEWQLQLGDCLQYLIGHQILHSLQAIKLHEQLSPLTSSTI